MSRVSPLRAAAAAVGVTVLAVNARADAPSDQYGLFGRSAETIQDTLTGLIWQRYAPSLSVNFDGAIAYCEGLSLTTPAGSSSGWRVPSYKELLTLVDETPHTEYVGDGLVDVWIDANAFPQTSVDRGYWTSSPYVPMPSGDAYLVHFNSGEGDRTSRVDTALYVRCVHDPGP